MRPAEVHDESMKSRSARPCASSSPHPPGSRWKRPNVWLGKAIPLILLVFVWKGWELVLYRIIPHVAARSRRCGTVYAVSMHVALCMTLLSYAKVYLHSRAPPTGKEPPEEVCERRVIFACDDAGEPIRCYRDRCAGAWQGIRSRHCRDCGTCRPVFDHHCAFMDNCIDAETHKAFFCFVLYAAIVLGLGLAPLLPAQLQALRLVTASTWSTAALSTSWWSRWYSWIGGPIWRYAGAILLGYRQFHLGSAASTSTAKANSVSLSEPKLSTLAIAFSASLILLIAISMIVVVARNAAKGLSTVQVERARSYRLQVKREPLGIKSRYDARLQLWIPADDTHISKFSGTILRVEPDFPLYDSGRSENMRKAFGNVWWKWLVPWLPGEYSDTDVRPLALAALRQRVAKAS